MGRRYSGEGIYFLSVVGESINEQESKIFKEGLNSKVKLLLYRMLYKTVEFKADLHGALGAECWRS